MQCSECCVVYSNALNLCPRCGTSASVPFEDSVQSTTQAVQGEPARMFKEDTDTNDPVTNTASKGSTLIEFPGSGRAVQPAWRKELSDRVREIQERRSREALIESEKRDVQRKEHAQGEPGGKHLGLVPQRDQPAINPLVAAALKRIERAQQPVTRTRSSMASASVAVARVAEEQFEIEKEIEPRPSLVPVPRPSGKKEQKPETEIKISQQNLLVDNAISATTPQPSQRVFQPITGIPVEIQINAQEPLEFYDDYAAISSRLLAGLIDLFVVAFASSPFAAIIELTNGDWTDERVLLSMSGVVLLIMFLYLTSSTALGGRTWGMSLLSLRTVDVDTGLTPTAKQSVTRTLAYMLSLATLGIGLLYAIVDAEGRTAHDYVSGTTVVHE